jgi:hypothetical protein
VPEQKLGRVVRGPEQPGISSHPFVWQFIWLPVR